jgi:hypothetical protein
MKRQPACKPVLQNCSHGSSVITTFKHACQIALKVWVVVAQTWGQACAATGRFADH